MSSVDFSSMRREGPRIDVRCLYSVVLLSILFGVAPVRAEFAIPEPSDWTEQGTALSAGPAGSWDARGFDGQISPCSVVKKDGTYFLYYVGADGDRLIDGGPANRALGVATSTDGINFTKYAGNPIITHLPHNNEEEGLFSAGATLDDAGNIVLFYGAVWAENSTTESVNGHVGLATSTDGLVYTDHGYVLSWNDPSVWGYGDEIFPLGAFSSGGNWYVYYGSKGPSTYWDLGIAWGPSPDNLTNSAGVLTSNDIIGSCDPIWLSEDKIAMFILKDFDDNKLDVHTIQADSPGELGSPVKTFSLPPYRHTTIMLDRDSATWFMYQATDRAEDGDHIRVMTAPAVEGPVHTWNTLGNTIDVAAGTTPGIAVDSQGRLHLVYMSAGRIYYRLGDADGVFGAAEEIPLPGGASGNYNSPHVVVDVNDTPHFVFEKDWASSSTRAWYTNRIGGTWRVPLVAINSTGGGRANYPRLAVYGSTAIVGILTGIEVMGRIVKITNLDTTPTVARVVETPLWVPAPCIDAQGNLSVVGRNGPAGHYVQAYDMDLNTIGAGRLLSSGTPAKTGEPTGACVDHAGVIHAAGSTAPGEYDQIWYNSTARLDAGQSSLLGLDFDQWVGELFYPTLAADSSGAMIYMAYRDIDDGSGRATIIRDGTFGAPVTFAPSVTSYFRWNPQIAAAPGGGVYVAWDFGGRAFVRSIGLGSGENQVPVAYDQDIRTLLDEPKTFDLDYRDADGPTPRTFTLVSEPVSGALAGTGATRTYTPDTGFSGQDSFTWKVEDGDGAESNVASCTIHVLERVEIDDLWVASGTAYVWDTLELGKLPYIDRAYAFSVIPSDLVGLDYLKTANADKQATDNPFIRFSVNQPVTVYVARDAANVPRPTWLAGWVDEGDTLTVDAPLTLNILSKEFPAGQVELGANEGPDNACSMYSVAVAPNGVVSTGDGDAGPDAGDDNDAGLDAGGGDVTQPDGASDASSGPDAGGDVGEDIDGGCGCGGSGAEGQALPWFIGLLLFWVWRRSW